MITVGVDLGGANIRVLVLGDDDEHLGWARLHTPMGGDRESVMDVMTAAVDEAIDDAGLSRADVTGVGVGTPGAVIDGTVGGALNVPGWFERFGLSDILGRRLDLPVRIANDVSAAAVAEHRSGAAAGARHALVVFVGTGVGAGLILDDELYEGANGGAGEFGHMVVRIGGAVMPDGRRGAVEAYAGRRFMAQAAERARAGGRSTILFDVQDRSDKARLTSGVFRDAIAAGDELAADLLDAGIEALGAGIASAVNLLDVEVVVLGGGLADKLGAWYLDRVQAATWPNLFLRPPRVRLVPAALGDEGGALGAALLARDLA